jgi:beta-lactamase class A
MNRSGGRNDFSGTTAPRDESFAREMTRLETESGGRLGVATFDTCRKIQLSYRGNERFPMCSTFKVLAAATRAVVATLAR